MTGIDASNNLYPATRVSCVDIWDVDDGYRSISCFYIDNNTPVSDYSIRLPLELFVGRPAVNPGEHDVIITTDMLPGLLKQLLGHRRRRRFECL